jgi:hypothetical protein
MTKRWVQVHGTNQKVLVDTDATNGAALGENLFYQGQLIRPQDILNRFVATSTTAVYGSGVGGGNGGTAPGGDTTTDAIGEGRFNLYFTVRRAQDAVGSILVDTADIDLTYDDTTPLIAATLTTTGVTAGTYGDATHVGQFTVDSKGRIIAASDVAISGGGGSSPLAAKGDLYGFSTVDARIPVGADGDVLVPSAAAPLGLIYITPPWLRVDGTLPMTGDLWTRPVGTFTGGNDIYTRNLWTGNVGYHWWHDNSGTRTFGIGHTDSSHTSLSIFVGATPVGIGDDAITIEDDGTVTIPNLVGGAPFITGIAPAGLVGSAYSFAPAFHGPTGTVELQFDANITRFSDLASEDRMPARM